MSLCEQPAIRFRRRSETCSGGGAPWYFANVAEALLRFMDRRKARLVVQIAETTVTREIFRWIGKALATRRGVAIEGNSRFGKTEAIRTFAAMNPGRVRIVETPSSACESDLLRAVARALGLEITPQLRGHTLRAEIETILRRSGLCLIFEEAQFLYPSNFNRNTMPARLNWVRRTIMDAKLPCVFIRTPQSHSDARARYVKATGFAMEQLDTRFMKTVQLPEKIEPEDLLAIARIHFPGLPESYRKYVVEKAAATQRNYCSDVSNIAALAFSNAEDAGRASPNLEDIKAAIADVLPAPKGDPCESPERLPSKRPAKRVQTPCKADSAAFQRGDSEPLLGGTPAPIFEPADRADSLATLTG